MNKRRSVLVLSAIAALLAVSLLTFFLTYDFVGKKYQKIVDGMERSEEEFSSLAEVRKLIGEYFLGTVDHDSTQEALIRALVSSLGDPYSRYLNASEYAEYETSSEGSGYGIGVRVAWDVENGCLLVYSVFSGTPAEEAGILPGDRITRVNDKAVTEYGGFAAAVNAITGSSGTTVQIHVLREEGGQTLDRDFEVSRRSVAVESVSGEMLDDGIGYVRIFSFNRNSDEQFRSVVDRLKGEGARGLVFDLRNNGGGDMAACVKMLDYILPEGEMFRVTDRDGNVHTYTSDSAFVDLPMTVLINRNSASASEIFAFSFKYFQAGALVGETTYGKGVAQAVLKLKDGGALILTNLRFTPPDGESIDGIGVKPDVAVESGAKNLYLISRAEDRQLQRAIEIVREKLGDEIVTVDETDTAESAG